MSSGCLLVAILVAFPLAICRASGHSSSRQGARTFKCMLHSVTGQASRSPVPVSIVVFYLWQWSVPSSELLLVFVWWYSVWTCIVLYCIGACVHQGDKCLYRGTDSVFSCKTSCRLVTSPLQVFGNMRELGTVLELTFYS